jgi:hypothetical protein
MSTPDPDDLITLLRLAAAVPGQPEPDLRGLDAQRSSVSAACRSRPSARTACPPRCRSRRGARKCWSKDGLTERDMAREGYRFKAGRDEQTLRMIHRRIAHEIGGGFDRVGPTLVAELRRILEPIPKG